jgi:hypothetical protein
MRFLRVLVAFAMLVVGVVSTIGSGGGGGAGSSDWGSVKLPPGCCAASGPTPNVDITTSNAQDVSATVVQGIDKLFDVAVTIGGQIFPSPPAAPYLLSGNSKFELFEKVMATGEPGTDKCVVSGAVTVSANPWNVRSTLSDGAVLDLVFETCDDDYGYTLDGSFTLFVRGLDGDTRSDVFQLKYELQNVSLTVTSGVDNYVTLSAPYLLYLDWNSLDFPVVVLTAWPNLGLASQADNYSWNLGGEHMLTVNADLSITTTTAEARSLIKSAVLGDYLFYEIVSPLQSTDGEEPESGEILIDGGAGNGTVRIVIESSTSVRLMIDVDGDGIVDDYQYTTWSSLRG